MKKRPHLPDDDAPMTARQLIDHANIDHEARQQAAMGLPAADQATLSNAENDAIEAVENRVAGRRRRQDDQVKTIRETITELPDPRTDRNLKELPQRVLNEIMSVFSVNTPLIKKIVAAERKAQAALTAWRDDNGLLHREPHYPLSKIKHFAWVFVIILVEAVCNMFAFLPATPLGYAGAIAVSLLLAGANVVTGVSAGAGPMRYLNLPAPSVRYWAIPALVLAAATVLFLNIYASHMRDLAATTPAKIFNDRLVLAHIVAEPFSLSFIGCALLVLGLMSAIAGAWKGYKSSDPFPAYEQRHRAWVEPAEDLDDLKGSLHAGLDAVQQAEIVYAADKPIATRATLDTIRKAHAALVVDQERAQQLDASDIKAGLAAVNRFRERNKAIRTDGVVPAYFKVEPSFAHLLKPTDAAATLTPLVEAAVTTHLEHTEKFMDLITRLLRMIENAKDNTDRMMAAIEKSYVDDKAIPDISELRRIVADEPSPAPKETVHAI